MNKIYVGNLSFQLNENDLQSAFEQFGTIQDVALITDRQTGRSKGFGFVTFETDAAAKEALALDGTELEGRPLRVNIAREKTAGDRR